MSKRELASLPRAFPELTDNELQTLWGPELKVARSFGREMDLYRAITFYKRALILMPPSETTRRHEAEFGIVLGYYLGEKYNAAVESFESSSLSLVHPRDFPAFEDLLILLDDAYRRVCEDERADQILDVLRHGAPDTAADLEAARALSRHNVNAALDLTRPLWKEDIQEFKDSYCSCRLDPERAKVLQALLPGAGYWYVGQRQSGVTSFLLNAAFSAAAWHFYKEQNWGAALFVTSLEFGWYVGGVYGAGLAAEQWNEHWYQENMRPFLKDRRWSPALMLQYSF